MTININKKKLKNVITSTDFSILQSKEKKFGFEESILSKKNKNMPKFNTKNFAKKNFKVKEIKKGKTKKKIARVALLTGCVQKEIYTQINEATIRILNRHGVEVITPKKIRCCGSLSHHLGKNEDAHKDFINNINTFAPNKLARSRADSGLIFQRGHICENTVP